MLARRDPAAQKGGEKSLSAFRAWRFWATSQSHMASPLRNPRAVQKENEKGPQVLRGSICQHQIPRGSCCCSVLACHCHVALARFLCNSALPPRRRNAERGRWHAVQFGRASLVSKDSTAEAEAVQITSSIARLSQLGNNLKGETPERRKSSGEPSFGDPTRLQSSTFG